MNLPIFKYLAEICSHALNNPISCVMADTGSGKSTQIPLELAALGRKCLVATPTVSAAKSLSRFVQTKTNKIRVGFAAGGVVEYSADKNALAFCTAGHLQRLLMRIASSKNDEKGLIDGYDTLVLDEAHTVSLDYDMLECLIKYIWKHKHHKFHLVIASATLDPEVIKHKWSMGGTEEVKVTQISVPHLPVEVIHSQKHMQPDEKGSNKELLAEIVRLVVKLNRDAPAGHFLVFLPGAADIDTLYDLLYEQSSLSNTEVYPAYSSLPEDDIKAALDQHVRQPNDFRRSIILATDIFETSVTIPGVVAVIDSGLQKVMRLVLGSANRTQLVQEWTSSFSLIQRKGRTGRTNPGRVYRMFTRDQEQSMRQRMDRELDRVPLFSPVIQLLHHGLKPTEVLPADLESNVQETIVYLKRMTLIDDQGHLSSEARFIVNLPLEIPYGVMLNRLPRSKISCMFTAILQSIQGGSLFYLPRRNREESPRDYEDRIEEHKDKYYGRFTDRSSDLFTTMRVVLAMQQETSMIKGHPKSVINYWCTENSMNAKTARSILQLWQRLERLMNVEQGKPIDDEPAEWFHTVALPTLYPIFGSEYHYVDIGGHKWRLRDTFEPIQYRISRGACPGFMGQSILALSRYHVVKGDYTLGFLSCVVGIDEFLAKLRGQKEELDGVQAKDDSEELDLVQVNDDSELVQVSDSSLDSPSLAENDKVSEEEARKQQEEYETKYQLELESIRAAEAEKTREWLAALHKREEEYESKRQAELAAVKAEETRYLEHAGFAKEHQDAVLSLLKAGFNVKPARKNKKRR